MSGDSRAGEVSRKIDLMRRCSEGRVVRLRGTDWFAWATAGGSSTVLLAAETGIAEVVVTGSGAWVVTDTIEGQRLRDEELPEGFSVQVCRWAFPQEREVFVRQAAKGAPVISDRPQAGEGGLPHSLMAAKRMMTAEEIARYRDVGSRAAAAMAAALNRAEPGWTELQLSGAGAEELLRRGLEPTLMMAAGERRLQIYRHPMPTYEPLGDLAMLVFCARGFGLYANLTRFVSFGPLAPELAGRHRIIREVEASVLAHTRPGTSLAELYNVLAERYAAVGHPDAIGQHHQGGTTGYLSREVIAVPECAETLAVGTAVAWNPSIPGAKVEDTFVVTAEGLENLTLDRQWPVTDVDGRPRPLILER